jgi:hypothetical protein
MHEIFAGPEEQSQAKIALALRAFLSRLSILRMGLPPYPDITPIFEFCPV